MKLNQKVTITTSDAVMNRFKGLKGIVKAIHKDGAEIEFEKPIHKSGQKTLFFSFDLIV